MDDELFRTDDRRLMQEFRHSREWAIIERKFRALQQEAIERILSARVSTGDEALRLLAEETAQALLISNILADPVGFFCG